MLLYSAWTNPALLISACCVGFNGDGLHKSCAFHQCLGSLGKPGQTQAGSVPSVLHVCLRFGSLRGSWETCLTAGLAAIDRYRRPCRGLIRAYCGPLAYIGAVSVVLKRAHLQACAWQVQLCSTRAPVRACLLVVQPLGLDAQIFAYDKPVALYVAPTDW